MSSLSALDKAKLEDVFEMQGGYVGNYNNQSFRKEWGMTDRQKPTLTEEAHRTWQN